MPSTISNLGVRDDLKVVNKDVSSLYAEAVTLVMACVVQTGKKRLIKVLHATMSQYRSRLSTSTCLMKCHSQQDERWQKAQQRKIVERKKNTRGGRE